MATPHELGLERLSAVEHSLKERLSRVGEDPAAVLAAGEEVLAFADLEERLFFPILPLLDPRARAELEQEHGRLADDLQLLRHLISGSPGSSDVAALASALAERLRTHIARDGRLIAQAQRFGPKSTAPRSST